MYFFFNTDVLIGVRVFTRTERWTENCIFLSRDYLFCSRIYNVDYKIVHALDWLSNRISLVLRCHSDYALDGRVPDASMLLGDSFLGDIFEMGYNYFHHFLPVPFFTPQTIPS